MARRSPASSSSVANALDKPGSSSYYYRPYWPKKQHFQVPYHKLDDIEEDCSDKVDLYESYIPKEEDQQEESSDSESESESEEGKDSQAQVPASSSIISFARLRRRKNLIMSNMPQQRRSSRGVVGLRLGSSSSSSSFSSRRTRWRRMRMRINLCRVRFNWLSPFEFLKKLRKAYIQAMLSMSSKEGQCGLVMMGSPWSFPVVVPFRNGAC